MLGSCSRAHLRSCLSAHTTQAAFRSCDPAAASATAAAEDPGPVGMLPRALGTRGYRRAVAPMVSGDKAISAFPESDLFKRGPPCSLQSK